MNCNRISSYIRQLLHLNIIDHCLLGRLITLNVDIMTVENYEDRELTVLHHDNETITHTVFYNKRIAHIDPFKTYDNKISLFNTVFDTTHGMTSPIIPDGPINAIYTCYQRGGVDNIISISHINDDHRYLLKMRSKTWYTGGIWLSGGIKRYDIFNYNDTLVRLI